MIHRLALPPVCPEEVWRYAGMKAPSPEVAAVLEEALVQVQTLTHGSVCWQEFPICRQDDLLDLGFAQIRSASLERQLDGCDRVVVFAATIGLQIDRLLLRYGTTAPAKALLLQAIGAERIEALCDAFQQTLAETFRHEGLSITGRFSPGYGDLPLEFQKEVFRVLDCPRQIGLSLNESLLMSPSKSVTALIGIGACPSTHHTGCSQCTKTNCIHRRSL